MGLDQEYVILRASLASIGRANTVPAPTRGLWVSVQTTGSVSQLIPGGSSGSSPGNGILLEVLAPMSQCCVCAWAPG